MKAFAIIFQILGFYSRRAGANKWLRPPTHKKVQPSSLSEPQKLKYLRVDAAPNTITATEEEGWEEEVKGEVMMELDQLGQMFDDAEESTMDMFELEQVEEIDEENKDILLQ